MESDSRSSFFLFVQGNSRLTNSGKEGGRSANHSRVLNDEAIDRERPDDEELQADLHRRNCREVGGASQEDLAAELPQEVKKEKNENHCSYAYHDPMVGPIQAVQEALERELQRFKEIEQEDFIIHRPLDVGMPSEFTSDGGDFPGPSTSEQSQSGDSVQYSFNSVESEVVRLKQNLVLLQNNLNEAAGLVKFKEARVAELQSILSSCSKKEEMSVGIEFRQNTGDIESELEDLFRQKIEAEVECLTISRAAEKLKVAYVEQVTLFEEQKRLASEQAQTMKKLGALVLKLEDGKSKAASLKTQAKKLKNCCEDIMDTNETLMLQKRVCKYSICFLIQLVLLLVLGLFLLQQVPPDVEVVPT